MHLFRVLAVAAAPARRRAAARRGRVLPLVHHAAGGAVRPAVKPLRPVRRTAPAAAQLVVVDVVGAVRRPGLYHLRQGTRIADAVLLAGGATAKAELGLVNLAAPLADGEQVVVPIRSPVGGVMAASPPAAAASPAAPLDLNTATAESSSTACPESVRRRRRRSSPSARRTARFTRSRRSGRKVAGSGPARAIRR